ncbi:hypothetical protein LTR99_007357 [Exophiala xenobiotica]|uniref:Uncharacterized protein n=1 Tax=Vermiconidia calcicola TaxID=1690605 RepID=A0AAV9Q456_9PEZI|nr:hypothetical protein LTR96_007995 [Exophiala xenobiotica]KAK5534466.1 hypothetical protein LTR25_006498 [Vermiconidia calcicola]KAK5544652.1 hypothetical protein LTR23_004416 [Chaetothyriales sp. CCFEE 6169]KAK5299089.1 hypothetical protein LTR99_007357 [Exophiala xenobiotica]KAK5334775.1 hypothetical protein LTR98_009148 [Exophiala xenobiotica]
MAPTTLMTFLVRVPPKTRSVSLYGSWDNFSTAYPMQRDTRTGPEHWSGCHSFSNIICDGGHQSTGTPREGGLRMGGTYWYYYTLDDDIEFHNSAEPSTTACPLLPGQLVNVLNVPFALSSSRSRNDSVSSTSSEFRTMDPSDKFMNPRPVPAKPFLPRLKTSPPLAQQPWPSSSSPVSADHRRGRSSSSRGPSQPSSATTLRIGRLSKKPSLEAPSRSVSRGSNRSAGIIGAIRALKSPRIASPDSALDRGRPEYSPAPFLSRGSARRSVTPPSSTVESAQPLEFTDLPSAAPTGGLALRQDFDAKVQGSAPVTIASFAQHRRQRSLSREPSSLRNPLTMGSTPERKQPEPTSTPYRPLETLKEVASPATTPGQPLTAVKIEAQRSSDDGQVPIDLEKRLPTLPNTPSSAYPPSSVDGSPTQHLLAEMENLQSRFSSTTIETGSNVDSYIDKERSHFSDWTLSTTRISPKSEYSSSVIDIEPMSPPVDEDCGFADFKTIEIVNQAKTPNDMQTEEYPHSQPNGLPTALSLSTISSVVSSAAPSSHADLDSAKEASFSWSKFQHYSLPSEEVSSGVTLKPTDTHEIVSPLVLGDHHRPAEFRPQVTGLGETSLPHSSSMQQLLDELSYLGGMIQQH